MRKVLAVGALLLCVSCEPKKQQSYDAQIETAVAADVGRADAAKALKEIESLKSDVSTLEGKVGRLEAKVSDLELSK